MPILIALAALAVTVYFIVLRARRGAEMASDLMDIGQDVRAAARRFGFKRRTDVHPVDSIDDPRLAVAALATTFAELDDLPTQETRATLGTQLRIHLKADAAEAIEMAVLGRWLATMCGGPVPAVPRLAKRLRKLDEGASFPTLMAIIQGTSQATDTGLSPRQAEALRDVERAFKLT